MSIGPNGALTVTGRTPLGKPPEGIVFSVDSQYVYVGDHSDKTPRSLRINNGKPVSAGPPMVLPGEPASMRAAVR